MTSQSIRPLILPVFWQTNSKLDASFVEGLKIFYSRVPFFELEEQPFIYGEDIDALLARACEYSQVSWIAVFAVGTVFASQLEIVRQVEKFISSLEEDVLVCGHLMNKKGYYCGLHEQCFLVNIKTYNKLGRPRFGAYERSVRTLQSYEAGESVHDDYTPKFVRPLKERCEYTTKVCGWNFVDASLKAGLPIFNLPDDLRRAKTFIYPDDETEKLNRNIRMLHAWEDLANPTQRGVLAHLLMRKMNISPGPGLQYPERTNCLFFFNTESLLPPDPGWRDRGRGPLDVYSGPCSGFQDLAFLRHYGFHDQTRIILYDFNRLALKMKEFIYSEFDGRLESLPHLLNKIREDNPHEEVYSGFIDFKIRELMELFNNDPEELYKTWSRVRKLPRQIIKLNLLGQSDQLLEMFKPQDKVMMNVTDIFLGQNELTYGYDGMLAKFTVFREKAARFPGLMLTGKSLKQVRFLDFAARMNVGEI